jgi:hypothetical protein
MEALRVLKLLNTKASREFHGAMLEEAGDTVNQAIIYFLTTFNAANEIQTHQDRVLIQCQAKLSALLLRKVGVKYRILGEQREDESLIETGKSMVVRSSQILKLCRTLGAADTCPPLSASKRRPQRSKHTAGELSSTTPKQAMATVSSPCRTSSKEASDDSIQAPSAAAATAPV